MYLTPDQEVDEFAELVSKPKKGRINLGRVSWWPLPSSFWQQSAGNFGHWSTRHEVWYTTQRNALEQCFCREESSSKPLNPKSAKQWRTTTRFGGYAKSALKILEKGAASMIRSHGKYLEVSGLPYTS